MKICHITTVHSRYDIRIFWKEAISASKAGFDVTIILNDSYEDEVKNGVKIISIRQSCKNRVSRIFSISVNKKVLKKAISLKADIYQFHDPELLHLGIKLKSLGYNVIYDVHEDVPHQILVKEWLPKISRKLISLIFEIYENRYIKQFSAIVVPTPHIMDRCIRLNQSVWQVCNFPSIKEIKFSDINYSNKNPTCYIGDLSVTRGLKQILAATAMAGVKLKLCGEFHPKSLKDELSHDFDHFEYLGFLNRNEINLLLSNSSIGFVTLLNTPNDANSYPIKMFEYMAAGIPVISSNFPLYKKIIEENNCGICVDPTDIFEISKAIRKIVDNEKYAHELRTNGYLNIIQSYNWEDQSQNLFACYSQMDNINL